MSTSKINLFVNHHPWTSLGGICYSDFNSFIYGFDKLSFIKSHRYQKVYENDYFILFVPPVPARNEI